MKTYCRRSRSPISCIFVSLILIFKFCENISCISFFFSFLLQLFFPRIPFDCLYKLIYIDTYKMHATMTHVQAGLAKRFVSSIKAIDKIERWTWKTYCGIRKIIFSFFLHILPENFYQELLSRWIFFSQWSPSI